MVGAGKTGSVAARQEWQALTADQRAIGGINGVCAAPGDCATIDGQELELKRHFRWRAANSASDAFRRANSIADYWENAPCSTATV